MKIAIILGTRPEIIKMSPIIRVLEQRRADYFILHTGQHYSYRLDKVFFEQLGLPAAKYNLEAGSGSHAEETARILVGVERVLQKEEPDIVLVEGDTNSVFAGALAATKLNIQVGHVEAGLRSYDRQMPEEINRILVDHCADYLFAPTPEARKILIKESIPEDKIHLTGNTIVDAIYQNMKIAGENGSVLKYLNLVPRGYYLVTVHRRENVDNPKRFASILGGLANLALKSGLPVIYPIHPHSRDRIAKFALEPRNIKIVEATDYFSFLQLEGNAKVVLTDSGGVQEEACILGVPCVTLRDNTERPETIEIGANILAGAEPSNVLECVDLMCQRDNHWGNPFGDGKAGEKIVQILIPQE